MDPTYLLRRETPSKTAKKVMPRLEGSGTATAIGTVVEVEERMEKALISELDSNTDPSK